MNLTAEDKTQIENAITEAEKLTSGEIITVIAQISGDYYYIPYLWAACLALIIPWPLIHWTWMPVQTIYLIQLGVFGFCALGLHYAPLRFALVPRALKRKRAHQRATEQFLAQNLYTMPDHTGVLLFLSISERYAEIIADAAIHSKIQSSQWQNIVDNLTINITNGKEKLGLIQAIEAIGLQLKNAFPAKPDAQNMLSNHLILLDSKH